MARSRNHDFHSDPTVLLLFVPSHFHREKYGFDKRINILKAHRPETKWEEWNIRHAYFRDRKLRNVEGGSRFHQQVDAYSVTSLVVHPRSVRGPILKTYLLVSSTTVASINSVDLSLTITWQSSASGDLIIFFCCIVSGQDRRERDRKEEKNEKR